MISGHGFKLVQRVKVHSTFGTHARAGASHIYPETGSIIEGGGGSSLGSNNTMVP